MTTAYHNTNGETGQEFKASNIKAVKQEDLILNLFKAAGSMSPSEVHTILAINSPLTSIRRAISNLTYAGKLEKTPNQRKGMYGKSEYIWKLV
jgi:hypothetical protein